jgi:hypothetical protein
VLAVGRREVEERAVGLKVVRVAAEAAGRDVLDERRRAVPRRAVQLGAVVAVVGDEVAGAADEDEVARVGAARVGVERVVQGPGRERRRVGCRWEGAGRAGGEGQCGERAGAPRDAGGNQGVLALRNVRLT